MKINIMGHIWDFERKTLEQEPRLNDCDGFCDWTSRKIIVRIGDGTLDNMNEYVAKVARHEIVHAFLFESGLGFSSLSAENWAVNEEMVDWFARKGPDIMVVWEKVRALEGRGR